MTDPTRRRGFIYGAELVIGRKWVLVVSDDSINELLREPVCLLVTERWRDRSQPTYVEIEPGEGGIREPSFVLCHFVLTLDEQVLDSRPLGDSVSFGKMQEVEHRLRHVLVL